MNKCTMYFRTGNAKMIIDKREMIGTVHLIIGREYKSSSIKI